MIAYRLCERTVAGVALVFALPLIAILMVLIRLDSPGPALFVQKRIAHGGRRAFRFIKLRSMYIDAKERFPDLSAYQFSRDEVGQVKLSLDDDPRVTRMGRFIRKTSLDELPNFWNVLTGEMALVGPRPEMWIMRKYYDDRTMHKFAVLPGVTGYAQVRGRGNLTFDETVEQDLEYVREASIRTDVTVIRETVAAVLFARGAH